MVTPGYRPEDLVVVNGVRVYRDSVTPTEPEAPVSDESDEQPAVKAVRAPHNKARSAPNK